MIIGEGKNDRNQDEQVESISPEDYFQSSSSRIVFLNVCNNRDSWGIQVSISWEKLLLAFDVFEFDTFY